MIEYWFTKQLANSHIYEIVFLICFGLVFNIRKISQLCSQVSGPLPISQFLSPNSVKLLSLPPLVFFLHCSPLLVNVIHRVSKISVGWRSLRLYNWSQLSWNVFKIWSIVTHTGNQIPIQELQKYTWNVFYMLLSGNACGFSKGWSAAP